MADPTFDSTAQSFDAADAAAYAAINAANNPEPVAPASQAAPASTPTPATAETPAPVAATTPKVVSLNDDDLVELLQNGQIVQRPWKEAKASTMMHADYTRKTQEVAAARKELEGVYTQMVEREQKIASFLQNRTAMEQYLQTLQQQQVQENPNISQNELASMQDVRRLLQQEMASAQQKLAQTVEAKTQEIAVTQAAASIKNDLDSTVKTLKSEFPALSTIKGIDKILYDEVNAMNPSSVEEAKQFFVNAAKAQVEALESHFMAAQKQAAVAKTKLTKQGIEPSGPGILPSPKTYKKFDDPDLNKEVIAQIEALMKS
jgi:myosin heavy subunit